MRSRSIKCDFFKDEKIAELSFVGRLLFIGLWCMADRDGKFEFSEKRIKAEIFPYETYGKPTVGLPSIYGEIANLVKLGFIKCYEIDGKTFCLVVNFKKHQSPHHSEKKSCLPNIPLDSNGCLITVDLPLTTGRSRPDSRLLTPDLGLLTEDCHHAATSAAQLPNFTDFYQSLKTNPAYANIDIDRENSKIDLWLALPKNKRRKKTRQFVLAWLNRIDAPLNSGSTDPYEQFLILSQKKEEAMNAVTI